MQRISKELKKLQFSNPGEKMKRMTSTARLMVHSISDKVFKNTNCMLFTVVDGLVH